MKMKTKTLEHRSLINVGEHKSFPFCTLDMGRIISFYQFYEYPKKPPILNMILARIYRSEDRKKFYREMEEQYNIYECDIRNTLSARDRKRQEDRVIKSLCEYFNINRLAVHITLENHIANYDFEQKKFKRGRKSQKDIEYFLTEYDKSWNTETINRYLDEWIEKEENEFGRDDSVDQFIEELETEDSIEEFYANFFTDPKGSLERLARALNKN